MKMRKLMGFAVLAAILYVCLPVYGDYLLVYDLSCSEKGVNDGVKATIPMKAYFVFRFGDNSSFKDANLIIYGKDSSKRKVYIEQDYDLSGLDPHRLGVNTWWNGDYYVTSFWCYNDPFSFDAVLTGKPAFKDIGLGTSNTKRVVSSMSGSSVVWMGQIFDVNDEMAGGGAMKATLWTAATKYANANGWTQDQLINDGDPNKDGLIQILQGKGYVEAVLP
jgi:hypothetical protein